MDNLNKKTSDLLGLIILAGISVILGILQPYEMIMNGDVGRAILQVVVVWTFVGGNLNDNDR